MSDSSKHTFSNDDTPQKLEISKADTSDDVETQPLISKAELQALEMELDKLRKEMVLLKIENERLLNEKKSEKYKTNQLSHRLEIIQEQILIIMWCGRDHSGYCSKKNVKDRLKYLQDMEDKPRYDRHLIGYHLDQLVNQGFLEPVKEIIDAAKGYALTDTGCEYFINNNLQKPTPTAICVKPVLSRSYDKNHG